VATTRTAATRWLRVGSFSVLVGVLSGLATLGAVIMPLFFFAAVTEPSTGTQRPLYRQGTTVALWLAVVVALGAGGSAARWRSRHEPSDGAPSA
jgi:hypothetical protein